MAFSRIEDIRPQPGKQELAFSLIGKVDFIILGGARYGGKVAPNDSYVQTPFGQKLNGDVIPGDIILNPEGCRQKVLAVHPHKDWDFYTITFADGSTFEAGLEHFFVAWKGSPACEQEDSEYDATSLFPQHASKVNVETLKDWLAKGYVPHIPVTKPVTYTVNVRNNPEIDPYALGSSVGIKSIPKEYLYRSVPERTALLQGLMDTDGTVTPDAKLYYTTTSEELAKDIKQLVQSLGGLATITSDIGSYRDKDGNKVLCKKTYNLYIRLHHSVQPFRLKRKAERYAKRQPKRLYRTITKIEYSRRCDGQCITVSHPNSLYLADDFIVTHNSNLMSMVPLMYQHDPNFRGIFFRRNNDQLIGGGSLYEYCNSMYKFYGARSRKNPITFTFPSEATVELRHMANSDTHEDHRGKSYSMIGFDEIDQFDQHEVEFLMTCLRSNADMDSFCIGTCNPSQSWVKPLIEWYLDDEGIPRQDRCGAIRFFVVKDGEFIFGDDEQFFLDNHHDAVFVYDRDTGKEIYTPPKTFTFVFFNIFDNPVGLEQNRRYLSELNNKPKWQRDRELYGNWNSVPQTSQFWQRDWVRGAAGERVKGVLEVPDEDRCIVMRGVDKAHTEPSESYKFPDYTAWSPKILKTVEGLYYLVGNYHKDLIDPVRKNDPNPVIGRVRKNAGERDALIVKQALYDGPRCKVVLARDKGAGAQDYLYTVAKLTGAADEFGRPARIDVVRDMTISNQVDKKTKDFQPFCNACQQGLVYIVEDTFDKRTLEAFYKELERFDGTDSQAMKKDD
jgi:phage terminase large subunit-like protein